MSDERRPFELEPESEDPAPQPEPVRKPAASKPKPKPAPTPEPRAEPSEGDVDTRTVAERRGDAIPRGTEGVEPPADWPAEAFSFPLRKPGPAFLIGLVVALLPLDLIGAIGAVAFFGWLLKLAVLPFLLRAQIAVIGSSAAGHDSPEGWERALTFDRDDLWPYARTVLVFAALLAPGVGVMWFGNLWLGLLLLAIGSMYASVVALGAALHDPGLAWPWRALPWLFARPLACLAGSVGWWVLVVTEWGLGALGDPALPLVGFLSLVLRAACGYALLVSARALGVIGRTWSAG